MAEATLLEKTDIKSDAKPEPAKRRPAIMPARFKLAEQVRATYHAEPEDGTPFEAVLDPLYWVHVRRYLSHGSHIEVMPADRSYFAELLVRDVGPQSVHVALLRKTDFEPLVAEQAAAGFDVKYKGTVRKHAVIRRRDNTIVQDGFETSDAAYGWLGQNARTLAA